MSTTSPLPPPAGQGEPRRDWLAPLRARLDGALLTTDSAAHPDARPPCEPPVGCRHAVLLRPLHAYDVATAVRFARERHRPVVVCTRERCRACRGADAAIVIDLAELDAICIDPVTRVARVGAGATAAALAGAAAGHGLVLVAGDPPSGFGDPIVRRYALASGGLIAAQTVTVEGEVVIASATERQGLFRAIREGRDDGGIVTEYLLGLVSVG